MKRILCLLVFLSLTAYYSQSQAQGAYIGIRAQPTISDFDVKDVNGELFKTTAVLGYGFGVIGGYNFSDHVGLQGEVLYDALSQSYIDNSNIERRIDLNYVHVPVLLTLNTNSSSPVNLNIVFGPQLGILVGSQFDATGTAEGDTITAVFGARTGDLGVAYGAGLDFNISPAMSIDIGYRGVFGLIDISDQSQSTATDQYYLLDRSHVKTYSAYVGLKFKLQ